MYDSFGNILSEESTLPFAVPFGFAGGLHDRDTGLVKFGYRDYDPETGRWTAKDPILFAGDDTDLYGYCVNDPVNFVDPPGLEAGDGSGIIGGYCYFNGRQYPFPDPKSADTPVSPDYEQLRSQIEWYVNAGGLNDLPCIANDAAQILISAEIGIWTAYTVPELLAALTPQQQEFIMNLIMSALPTTAPSPDWAGLAGVIISEIYGRLSQSD